MITELAPLAAVAPLETSGTNWPMIFLGALVVVGLLAAVWYFFIRKKKKGAD